MFNQLLGRLRSTMIKNFVTYSDGYGSHNRNVTLSNIFSTYNTEIAWKWPQANGSWLCSQCHWKMKETSWSAHSRAMSDWPITDHRVARSERKPVISSYNWDMTAFMWSYVDKRYKKIRCKKKIICKKWFDFLSNNRKLPFLLASRIVWLITRVDNQAFVNTEPETGRLISGSLRTAGS